MQDFDQTIATPGKTIQCRKFELRPHLIVLYPQAQFKQIPLETGTVILGRGQDAGIRLDDELVSRKHCSITFDGKSVIVKDLGSTNGTYVDGQPVSELVLEPDNSQGFPTGARSSTAGSANWRSPAATTSTSTRSWWTPTISNR